MIIAATATAITNAMRVSKSIGRAEGAALLNKPPSDLSRRQMIEADQ